MIGSVKFFNEQKGYGFITAEDGKEYFVHISGIKDNKILQEGDKVSFQVVQGDRGPKAEDVDLVQDAEQAQPQEESQEAEAQEASETEE